MISEWVKQRTQPPHNLKRGSLGTLDLTTLITDAVPPGVLPLGGDGRGVVVGSGGLRVEGRHG